MQLNYFWLTGISILHFPEKCLNIDAIKVNYQLQKETMKISLLNKLSLGERMGADSSNAGYECPLFDK